MTKPYDATQEFKPFERKETRGNKHPRSRVGATAKKAKRLAARKPVEVAPVTKGKKK